MNINTHSAGHTGGTHTPAWWERGGSPGEIWVWHTPWVVPLRALQHALNAEKKPVDQGCCDVPPMRGTKGRESSLTSVRGQGRTR